MADSEASSEPAAGDRVLDRLRKLVALDRALIEIGEPGVLERRPDELASLEARLFGAPSPGAGAPGADKDGAAAGGGVAPAGETAGLPALRLLDGTGGEATPAASDQPRRKALRARLRLIRGGLATG